ncbi:hypothetical protein B484DRAFT_407158, partial [Ochromonadaceae sp. CCMP2298]
MSQWEDTRGAVEVERGENEDEDEEDEEALDGLEVLQLARAFLGGAESAGEVLLEMSGDASRCRSFSAVVLDVLCVTCQAHQAQETQEEAQTQTQAQSKTGRARELAAGIIANLLLHDHTRAILLERDIFDLLCSYCDDQDPLFISELLRGLSVLAYKGALQGALQCEPDALVDPAYPDASAPSGGRGLARLASLCLHLSQACLHPRLLAQLLQLVYYVCASEESFEGSFEVFGVFAPLMYEYDVEGGGERVNWPALSALRGEMLGGVSGLEWLLLCLEKVTGEAEAEDKLDPT